MDYNKIKKISIIMLILAFIINTIIIVNSKPFQDESIKIQKFSVYTTNRTTTADFIVLSKEDKNCTFIITYDLLQKTITKELSKGINQFSVTIEDMPIGKTKVFLNYECN